MYIYFIYNLFVGNDDANVATAIATDRSIAVSTEGNCFTFLKMFRMPMMISYELFQTIFVTWYDQSKHDTGS